MCITASEREQTTFDRGAFLQGMAAAALATTGLLAATYRPALGAEHVGPRYLSLRRPGGPLIRAAFTLDGEHTYLRGYYKLCEAFLDPAVDPRIGYVQVHPTLIDAFWELQRRTGGRIITITSGYRTPATNERAGGKPKSYHLLAEAADFFQDGLTPHEVGRVIDGFPTWLVGGYGMYDDDGHVHIDLGPRYIWCNHSEVACRP